MTEDPELGKDYPRIKGRCPSCGSETLFRGHGGYVTCSVIGCKEPAAASDLLAAAWRPQAPTDWQPIESAPKDGTRILGMWFDYPMVQIVCCDRDGMWLESNSQRSSLPPDGWLPLPAVKSTALGSV